MSLFFLLPTLYLYRLFLSFLSSLRSENMESKVVVITGASSRIGEQLAYQYAKKGACLVLVARREETLRKVADRAREMGSPEVVVVPADVSMAEDCRRFVNVTINRFGRLDHLVNNAGITSMSLLKEYSDITSPLPIMDTNSLLVFKLLEFGLPNVLCHPTLEEEQWKGCGGIIIYWIPANAKNGLLLCVYCSVGKNNAFPT